MARILITSGPTRQYLDPVRYLTNASSGRMGKALAEAFLQAGHEVVIVSGPVDVDYPKKAEIVPIISTEDMLEACLNLFPEIDGMVGAAAPCDLSTHPSRFPQTGQDRRGPETPLGRDSRRRRTLRRHQGTPVDRLLSPWKPKTTGCGPYRSSSEKAPT